MTPYAFGVLFQQQLVTIPTIKQAGGVAGFGKTLGGAIGAATKAAPPKPIVNATQQAVKSYRAATTPLLTHATKVLPAKAQPAARVGVRAVGAGLTANTAYQTYDTAAAATSDAAQNVARTAGVHDQNVLNEVGSRARSQMIPMAYRALAPSWAGGDNTPVGQQVSQDLGTIAYHNISPALTSPSPVAVNWTPAERTMHAAFGNPMGAVSSAIFPARPSAQQMWQNVPQERQQEMTQNMLGAATSNATISPIARGMQHVFEPAIQYQQQQLNNAIAPFTSSR